MSLEKRVGILGAGQLGKMLCQAASDWDMEIRLLDKNPSFPAAYLSKAFICGDFSDYEDVVNFGSHLDIVTIEIEHVNTEALHTLASRGIEVYPDPNLLETIKDKGLQKTFFQLKGLPTSSFYLTEDNTEINDLLDGGKIQYPFVQKSRRGGYDGRGVVIIRDSETDLLETPSVIEPIVDIDKELAIIIARRANGEMKTFIPVEMAFHPDANLVEYLICPARIDQKIMDSAVAIAIEMAEQMNLVGILAIELFLTIAGDLLINEVAPRPHNSGHHTIESCITSQYQQHLRAILNLPLGSTTLIQPSVMINLLGGEEGTGKPHYKGFDKIMSMEGVYPHIYGKPTTKPWRKMGHVTVLGSSVEDAIRKAGIVRDTISVVPH